MHKGAKIATTRLVKYSGPRGEADTRAVAGKSHLKDMSICPRKFASELLGRRHLYRKQISGKRRKCSCDLGEGL